MLTRLLAGAILLGGLVLCAPAKAQEPATVSGDPATTNRSAEAENLRASNRSATKERRAENKRVSKEHKAEVKRARADAPKHRRGHSHEANPRQTHGGKRKNPNSKSNLHGKNKQGKKKSL
jgi:hypothetical protein